MWIWYVEILDEGGMEESVTSSNTCICNSSMRFQALYNYYTFSRQYAPAWDLYITVLIMHSSCILLYIQSLVGVK